MRWAALVVQRTNCELYLRDLERTVLENTWRRDPSPVVNARINFARDLQDSLGILALLALSAPFRICKLQIPLAA